MWQHYSYLDFRHLNFVFLKCYTVVLIFIFLNRKNQADPNLFKNSLTKGDMLLKYCLKYIWSGFLKTFEKESIFNPYALNNPFYINSHINFFIATMKQNQTT